MSSEVYSPFVFFQRSFLKTCLFRGVRKDIPQLTSVAMGQKEKTPWKIQGFGLFVLFTKSGFFWVPGSHLTAIKRDRPTSACAPSPAAAPAPFPKKRTRRGRTRGPKQQKGWFVDKKDWKWWVSGKRSWISRKPWSSQSQLFSKENRQPDRQDRQRTSRSTAGTLFFCALCFLNTWITRHQLLRLRAEHLVQGSLSTKISKESKECAMIPLRQVPWPAQRHRRCPSKLSN